VKYKDITLLAADCGATFYRNRASPHAPALAFGDEAWVLFIQRLEKEFENKLNLCPECGSKLSKQIPAILKGE
jgi:hypothetical protein